MLFHVVLCVGLYNVSWCVARNDCVLTAVKLASNGRQKRKQNESASVSSAATTDAQLPAGRKSRKRGQGQEKKVSKKAKTRKSQFERRNIR